MEDGKDLIREEALQQPDHIADGGKNGDHLREVTKKVDTISRQAAIEIVDFECGEWRGLANTIEKRLSGLPSEQPEQRWIPVDLQNNSPEENKVVLLGVRFRDDFKYFVTSRQDYNYWTGLGREIKGELRWQPLPEPYRKGDAE